MSAIDQLASLAAKILPARAPSPTPAGSRPSHRPRGRSRGAGFEAGEEDRLTYSWTKHPISVQQLITTKLQKLRARSRQQCRDNDYAKSYIQLLKTNVIGHRGIVFQSQPLNRDGNVDRGAGQAIEDSWNDYGQRKQIDIAGRRTWIDMQKLFVSTVATDGEFLAQIVTGPDAGDYQIALRPLDPEVLDVNLINQTRGGNRIIHGIELDRWSRPVAYWLRTSNPRPDAQTIVGTAGHNYQRFPASEIIHAFEDLEATQTRGIPWTATALMRLRMIGAYEKAALIAARMGASKIGHYKSTTGKGYTGDAQDADGNLLEDIEPGVIGNLPQGVDFEGWDPGYPSGDFGPFMKRALQGVAAGLDVTYHSLTRDLEGVSFSSSRTGTLEEREHYKDAQRLVIDQLCRPYFDRWLINALLLEKITIGGTPLPVERLDKYRRGRWMGRRWGYVDPDKDAKAVGQNLDRGLQSPSQAMIELGRDPEETWRQIKADQDRIKELGIELAGPTSQIVALVTQDEPPAPPAE